ncbi:hypothetical protein [Nonomuraea sp. B19D2]
MAEALHVGLMDTDMGARFDGSESSPEDVVRQAFDGVEEARSRCSPAS